MSNSIAFRKVAISATLIAIFALAVLFAPGSRPAVSGKGSIAQTVETVRGV